MLVFIFLVKVKVLVWLEVLPLVSSKLLFVQPLIAEPSLIPDCSAGNAFLYAPEKLTLAVSEPPAFNFIRNGHRDLNAIQTGIDVVDRVVGLSRYRAADHAKVSTVPILPIAVNCSVLAGQNHRADRAGQRDAVAGAAQYETVSASPLSRMVLLLPVMVMASEVMPSSTIVRPEAVISMLETAPL